MPKEAYYFSHDSNARSDPKILEMRSVYKSEGYGWFWILVEMMRDQEDYALSMEGKYVWNAFALQLDTTAEKAEAFVKDCIYEFKLFECEGDKFYSKSLRERMKVKEEKSEKARKSAEARWRKPSDTNEEMQTQCETDANALKNDAIKESKVNKIKELISDYTLNSDLQEAIKDFMDMRKKIKKPMTDRAVKLMMNELDKLASTDEIKIAILNQSIQNSWQGVFALKNVVGLEKKESRPQAAAYREIKY